MKKIVKQYLLSCYSDGTVRLTERALTKRNTLGQFTGVPNKCSTCVYRR